MCQILEHLQQYCPSQSYSKQSILPDGTTHVHREVQMIDLLFGGDQLTCARACTAKCLRSNHDNAEDQLCGVVPVVEDWHARMCLMRVRINSELMSV